MAIFTEENQVYKIDCTQAMWATDSVHEAFTRTNSLLNDVDFIIETEERLLLIEYKNACIPNVSNPEAFKPQEDKRIKNVAKKYYDTLHYLALLGKDKPKTYIYVLEYPNGDTVARKGIRNRIKAYLPFRLQSGTEIKLIDGVEVLSIDEWNNDMEYGRYPIKEI